MEILPEVKLRVRISSGDAHYAGNLVDGAHIMQLFGDVATELTIRYDGDEGLLRAYENVEFLEPVHGGDFLEVIGKIVSIGNSSRKIIFFKQRTGQGFPHSFSNFFYLYQKVRV